MSGECSSPLDKRLLRAAWFGTEGSDSNENGSGKGSFQEWFRSLMTGGRGGGIVGGSLREQAVQGSLAWPIRLSKQGRWVGKWILSSIIEETDEGIGQVVVE